MSLSCILCTVMAVSNQQLSQLYTDPTFLGAYTGLDTFRRHLRSVKNIRVTSERLREWRRSHDAYHTFKPTRINKYPRVLVQHSEGTSHHRYIDDLQHFVRAYNSTRHSSLGMAPADINPTPVDTARQVLDKMAGRKQTMPRAWDRGAQSKLKVGWWVRLRHATTGSFR